MERKLICSLCNSDNTEIVMDYGQVALAGNFLKKEEIGSEKKYPLRLIYCHGCHGIQVADKVPKQELFSNYHYHSSAIPRLRIHFQQYAVDVVKRFLPRSVLEIGCNDGVMLRHLAGWVPTVYGIDPAGICSRINGAVVIEDYFPARIDLPKFDLIVANNVFAHIDDIQGATKEISRLLTPNGVFVFEVHSLSEMIDKLQYDWVYHEHLYYYSIHSLTNLLGKFGLRIFDVQDTGLHAGSRRYFVCKDKRLQKPSVAAIIKTDEHLTKIDVFKEFAKKASAHKEELMLLLNHIKSEGKRIAGYGACGRANTMIQYCGITNDHLEYIIDDAPAKQSLYTPASHIHIRENEGMDLLDYILVFAWSFSSDILPRCMADAIIPLPNIHVVESKR